MHEQPRHRRPASFTLHPCITVPLWEQLLLVTETTVTNVMSIVAPARPEAAPSMVRQENCM
jgi:hypothetical protein